MKEKAADTEKPPTACPFCRSTNIAAPTETISTATYWRCGACGQMWNVGRQLEKRPASRWDRH